MRVGFVDLDTSHPGRWVPILRDLGHEVVCVYDSGDVYPEGYAESFAAEHDIPHVAERLDQCAELVDCALVCGANWDTHVDRARPFLDAGRSVFLDKPVAGRVDHLISLRQLVESGARVSGGSSIRFADEVRVCRTELDASGERIHTVLAGCGVDRFGYGVHALSGLVAIVPSDPVRVTHLGTKGQDRILVEFADETAAVVVIGPARAKLPFYYALTTDKRFHTFVVMSNDQLHRSALSAVLPFLAGQTDHAPMTPDRWLLPELLGIAALTSRERDGVAVELQDLFANPQRASREDGSAYLSAYREARLAAMA